MSDPVLIPFVVDHDTLNGALVDAVDVASWMRQFDMVMNLSGEASPMVEKSNRVRLFLDSLAASLRQGMREHEGAALPPLTINEMVKDSFNRALAHGFWEDYDRRKISDIANEKILLIISELTEAMEEIRKGYQPRDVYYDEERPTKPEGVPIELADAVIRIGDFCGWFSIPLEDAIRTKAAYNESRPYKHGKEF